MHRVLRAIAVPVVLGLALSAGTLPLARSDAPVAPAAQPPTTLQATEPDAASSERLTEREGAVAGATGRPKAESDRPESSGTAAPLPTQIVPGTANRASISMTTTYDTALTLNFGSRVIVVDTVLTATNRSGGPVDRIELNTIAARVGGMRITNVSVDGRAATATVSDQTILLKLGGILPNGATAKARIRYTATLRTSLSGSNWLFTKVNGIVGLYRWIPWVSRNVKFDRPNHGDPFITGVTPRVTVKVTTERPMVIAATGDRIAASGLTQTFEARNVRDFTLTAAPDYKTGSRIVGGTTVRVWYRPGTSFSASTALDQAAKAIERLGRLVGPYPYLHFKVVQSPGGYGMESPGLIWIPTGTPSGNMPYLVHHETAHQWFYGVVGGDQANEPFTDEAAADFLARDVLGQRRASRCGTARLDLSIYQYTSGCYYEIVYIQGGNFLNELRSAMGSTAFWRGMRAYVEAQRYRIAPTKTLLDTLDANTPLNLVPRYEARFPRLY